MSDRWMRAAEALLPPGDQVVECLGVTVGPNPDVIAGLVLAGLLVVEAAAIVVAGDGVPLPALLAVAVAARVFLFRARGVVASQHGRWLTGWHPFRGLERPLDPLGSLTLDQNRRKLWRVPVHAGDSILWFSPRQLDRLAAAHVHIDGVAEASDASSDGAA